MRLIDWMLALILWTEAMFIVYYELLIGHEISDRAKVTGVVAYLATWLIVGPAKATICLFVLMIIFAIRDERIRSKINSKIGD